MRLFPIFLFASSLVLLALLYPFEGLQGLEFIQHGEANAPPSSADAPQPEQSGESILNSRLGLIALIVLTVGGALLASQGKRFQAVNRFLRSGGIEE